MHLAPTDGAVRKAYIDSAIGQLHLRYVAPPEAEQRRRPVVLFAASPASGDSYVELLLDLGRDRIALAFDTPGYGESAPPVEPFDHPSQPAQLFADALLDLGLGASDSYGHHSGALLALALAAYHPRQVAHVAVSAVPYIRDEDRRAALRARGFTLHRVEQIEALQAIHFNKVSKRPAELPFCRAVSLYADALSSGVRMNWLIRNSYAEGSDQWLRTIRASVLFLQTGNSLRDATWDAAQITPSATIRDRPDLDHFALWTQAAEIATELRNAFDAA